MTHYLTTIQVPNNCPTTTSVTSVPQNLIQNRAKSMLSFSKLVATYPSMTSQTPTNQLTTQRTQTQLGQSVTFGPGQPYQWPCFHEIVSVFGMYYVSVSAKWVCEWWRHDRDIDLCDHQELSKITMPVIFNEPLSFIQRLSEYMEYSYLLKQASQSSCPIQRMEVSSCRSVVGGQWLIFIYSWSLLLRSLPWHVSLNDLENLLILFWAKLLNIKGQICGPPVPMS